MISYESCSSPVNLNSNTNNVYLGIFQPRPQCVLLCLGIFRILLPEDKNYYYYRAYSGHQIQYFGP